VGISYPELIKCPKCEAKIFIDYSDGKVAKTNDIFALRYLIVINQHWMQSRIIKISKLGYL
jgi:hypothetical protein